jgi:serine/threonine protein kinase/WD40 repeat protein
VTPNSSPSAPLSTDEAFAELVDELAARVQAGETIDLDELARAHPEYAARLGPLLPALQALAGLGHPTAANESALPATGVLGDFRIVREVGRGGMGVVYEAQQVSLGGRRVALKVLPFAGMFDPRHLLRFQNEARAAACLHHPHIVPVYAVGCDRGVHYYAMQFIDGLTLAAAIDGFQTEDQHTRLDTGSSHDTDPIPAEPVAMGAAVTPAVAALSTERATRPHEYIRTVARLGRQAASALDHAHQQGIIHRDIKPANLLLDGERNVWITDFGLAHFREECGVTRTGEVIGTLRYMSPEQTHGQRVVDQRTDIYSLGVTLYELLTLRPAFRGDDRQELLRQIATEEPLRARRFNPAVPAELETILAKAMAKAPEERYATAQELADDLQRWLDDRPIRARPPGPLQRARKWGRRHRPLVAGLAVSLALLAVGVVVGSVLYAVHESEDAKKQSWWAREREKSERKIAADLKRTLIGRADAMRLSRLPGYRRQVWADLREATSIQEANDHAHQMRTVILSSLGDPIGLDPVANHEAVPRQKRVPIPPDVEKKIRKTAKDGAIAGVLKRPDMIFAVENRRTISLHNQAGDKLQPLYDYSPLGAIYDLTVDPEGHYRIAGCEQGFFIHGPLRQWDVVAGNTFSVSLSPNGRYLAVGGQRLEVWSIFGSRPVASFVSPVPDARVEFSADGRILLAILNDRAVAGWEFSETPERRVFDMHTGGVPSVAFKPDGTRLVSVSKDMRVWIWDTTTGKITNTSTIGHAAEIESVAYNPDGTLFATGDFSGTVKVWDTATWIRTVHADPTTTPGQVWRVQFSSNGEYLVAAGVGGVGVWKVGRNDEGRVTLTPIRTVKVTGERQGAIDIVFRPGGSEIVYLTAAGQLYSFDLNRPDDPPRLLIEKVRWALRSLHFDPSGDRLTFITGASTFGIWHWREKKVTDTQRRAEFISLSPDGRWAALGTPAQSASIVDATTGEEIYLLPPEGSDIWSLSWSSDGTKLALGLSDGRVPIWDLEQVRARLAEFGIISPSTAR